MGENIVFADVDGTIFTAGWQIIKAPFYNVQTSRILKKHHIPLILVTGRPTWTNKSELLMKLVGIPPADAIIFGAGTIIYTRLPNGKLEKDFAWESKVQWNKNSVESFLIAYFKKKNIPIKLAEKDPYVVRVTLTCFPVSEMEKVKQDILMTFAKGIQVVFTEKLLKENTEDVFTGDLLVLPKSAGKDNAIKYLLEKYSNNLENIPAFIFGDATIDVPMLTMTIDHKKFLLSQYAVHPTPLAKKVLLKKQKENKNIVVTDDEGPQFILEIVKKYFTNNKDLSPAQNSKSRLVIKPFEPLLDKIIEARLTPNEISFLGFEKVKKGIDLLYEKNNVSLKIKGLYLYVIGNFTDLLDGIRARKRKALSVKREEQIPGQLVDVFCDRAKEFYQIFMRAKKSVPHRVYVSHTRCVYAMSCILPSIARAQAEIYGIIVQEQDEKGGSMFERTKLLFLSLLYDVFGNHRKSLEIDKEIYERNVATFENRIRRGDLYSRPIALQAGARPAPMFQRNALERFLLLVQLLQEENKIIEDYLKYDKKNLEEYRKQSEKLVKNYFNIDVEKLRKEYKFRDYGLSLND